MQVGLCLTLISFNVVNPVIVNAIRCATENVEFVLHASRNHVVNVLVAGLVVGQVQHVYAGAGLAKALDAAQALLQARRVPRQVDVDQRAQRLQVQAFAGCVGGHHQLHLAGFHPLLDLFALDYLSSYIINL